MKFARFSCLLHQITSFGSRNSYSTKANPIRPWQSSTTELYRRISQFGDPKVSIVPILDQWVEEGRSVDEQGLKQIINQLRHYNRYNHALEVSMWMTDKRYFDLNSSDAAIRVELISKTQGVEQAEKYFNNLSQKRKGHSCYCALLHFYVTAKCVEKAEALMQKMKGFGYAKKTPEYNLMFNLYYKTGNMEKLEALLQEMEENGIVHDRFTSAILFSAYASVMDVEKMDKIVTVMESDPNLVLNWNNYTAVATGYTKAGFTDKALEILKKAEAHVVTKGRKAYNYLIMQYATLGKKDEVLRIWSLYKKKHKGGYSHVLISLVKLGDFGMAEEIFNEWESQDDLTYNMYIPNIMIAAYSKKGLLEKAEALIDRAISKGGKPNAQTWSYLAEGYFQNEQPQKAVEMMKKAIVNSETWWKPDMAVFKACLEYMERVGDAEQSEEFAKLLKVKDMNIISLD